MRFSSAGLDTSACAVAAAVEQCSGYSRPKRRERAAIQQRPQHAEQHPVDVPMRDGANRRAPCRHRRPTATRAPRARPRRCGLAVATSFGTPVEPDVYSTSCADGAISSMRSRVAASRSQTTRSRAVRRGGRRLDDAVERERRGAALEHRRGSEHGRLARRPAAEQRGRELERVVEIQHPAATACCARRARDARAAVRRARASAARSRRARSTRRDRCRRRARRQARSTRSFAQRPAWRARRVSSSPPNIAPISTYAMKPL